MTNHTTGWPPIGPLWSGIVIIGDGGFTPLMPKRDHRYRRERVERAHQGNPQFLDRSGRSYER